MTRLKAALLAAAVTAGIPAMAMAQERPDREDRQRSEGPREQREGQGARPDRGQQAPQQQAPAPQAQPQRPPQPDQGQVRAQQVQQQQVQQAQAQNQQRAMEQQRGQNRGNFNGGDPRNERAQGYNGNAYNNGNRGYDARQNGNRGDVRTEQYRGNDRFGGAVRGNDWRQDRRYDWQGYRSQNRDLFRAPRYVTPRGWSYGYRRFEIGVRLPSFFFGQQYWIADPYAYRLPPAYGPYRWVRYYDDVLLVDLRTGQVVDEIPGFFY